jgi:hypothetical protein
MIVSGYTPEDLTVFKCVLRVAEVESLATGQDIPMELMAARVIRAAALGEQDPRRLCEAALGSGHLNHLLKRNPVEPSHAEA